MIILGHTGTPVAPLMYVDRGTWACFIKPNLVPVDENGEPRGHPSRLFWFDVVWQFDAAPIWVAKFRTDSPFEAYCFTGTLRELRMTDAI